MDQGIKTEHEINRCVRCDWNGASIVLNDLHIRGVGEPNFARFHAFRRHVDAYQAFAMLPKELGPTAKSGCDLQNRGSRKKHLDARVDDVLPKLLGSPPRLRPLVTGS